MSKLILLSCYYLMLATPIVASSATTAQSAYSAAEDVDSQLWGKATLRMTANQLLEVYPNASDPAFMTGQYTSKISGVAICDSESCLSPYYFKATFYFSPARQLDEVVLSALLNEIDPKTTDDVYNNLEKMLAAKYGAKSSSGKSPIRDYVSWNLKTKQIRLEREHFEYSNTIIISYKGYDEFKEVFLKERL
jgi:hypothetical protein